MRTSLGAIQRVTRWLEYFTLAELIFILKQDIKMYPFDRYRVSKIAQAVSMTFGGDQSENHIKMLLEDLSSKFKQTRLMIKLTSISTIVNRCNDHLLIPFQSSCPTCDRSLNTSNCKQRRIRLYCLNGSVNSGKMNILVYQRFHIKRLVEKLTLLI